MHENIITFSQFCYTYKEAIASIDNIVRQQAYVMAYNDCFYFMGFAILLCGLALVFCKKVKAGGNAAAH